MLGVRRPLGGLRLVARFFSNRPRAVHLFEEKWSSRMATGTVKRVISERGFGFIAAPDGKEYFFHKDGLTDSLDFDRLSGGEAVSFEVQTGPKGDRAIQVRSA